MCPAISSRKLGSSLEGQLKNNYLFQGAYSELDEELGWNDYALRNYDAQVGRWVQQDPYQEFATPYTYVGNDPINVIDPSGGSILSGLSAAGFTAAATVAGAFIGSVVDAVTGGKGKGVAIGAGIGLASGLGRLSMRIAASMGIQTTVLAINLINTGTNTGAVGFDHVWSNGGKNLAVVKGGTNSIYVLVDNVKKLATEVDLSSKKNRQLIATIFSYYAKQVGISMYANGGTGTFGLRVHPKNTPSSKVPAFTMGTDVFINKTSEQIAPSFSDILSTKSILEHEKFHQDDNKTPGFTDNSFSHSKVYIKQIGTDNFKNAPKKFQDGTVLSLARYLLQVEDEGMDSKSLVDDFNKNNGLGFKITIYQVSDQRMKASVYRNGKLIDTVGFTPEN